MPPNAILVPGTSRAGPEIQAVSLSGVQVMPDAFIGPEYMKLGSDAALRPTMPNRLGPSPLLPPLLVVWHTAQRPNTTLPLFASAASAAVAVKSAAAKIKTLCMEI